MSADKNLNLSAGDTGATDDSIQQVHAKLASEKPEPNAGFKTTPLFLLGFVSAMIFITSIYVVHYRAGFSPTVYDQRFDPAKAAAAAGKKELTPEQIITAGRKSFQQACAACHQTSGLGVAGVYPPLAGSELVLGKDDAIIRILLHGLNGPIVVKGNSYNGAMPAFGKVIGGGYNWNEEKISQVLTYIRQEWGNAAPPVAKEKVTEILAAEKARSKPWTDAELKPFE
jgi:mono/diheme cytochrome c family protein